MKILKPVYLASVATMFMISSCGMVIKSYIRKDDTNVPVDFGKE